MDELRALLLTDLVDSTQLTERLGNEAAARLSIAHDRVARDLLRTWRGREIDKTDGMLILFDHAADALGYAQAYHEQVAALPVPMLARAGLHYGPVTLRANSLEDVALGAKPLEVEGIAKPVAARVMSLAHGGQTLMTLQAREAIGPTTLKVQSHGHWRVRGIAEPMELFEAAPSDAPFTPPQDVDKVYRVVQQADHWLPRRELPRNLPAERDAFIGRSAALAALAQRFNHGARLVSLLGIGGTGKTRLATHFAWDWLGDYPGGAWFCDLSAARNLDGIAQAVATTLNVPLGKDNAVLQLGHAMASRGRCLIILDNFEQVARHADDTVGPWLDRADQACFLVTSREVLGLPGEEALALPPMALPEAQALFERRALAAAVHYAPSAEDAAALPPLIKLLDGLPLAIELAAARVRVMSPCVMLTRMHHRFKLLAAGGGRHDRQATLRATLDWSWDLLNEAEKSTLAQLSVFENGFTLEAAEAVVSQRGLDAAFDTVELLQVLVEKSLVRQTQGRRFELLNSVRDYAAERLHSPAHGVNHALGLRPADVEKAHCRHYASLSAPTVADVDNLVVACRRAVQFGDARHGAAALEKTWSVLTLCGPFNLCAELADTALQSLEETAEHARLHLVAGSAKLACGLREPARLHFQAALLGAGDTGQTITQARAQCALGSILCAEGHVGDGAQLHQQALATAQAQGDADLLCTTHNAIAKRLMTHGHADQARTHYEQGLQVARRAGLLRWQGGLLGNLGNLESDIGRPEQARLQYLAALQVADQIGDLKFAGNTHSNLGLLDHVSHRPEEAKRHFEEALNTARDIGHRLLEAVVLCNLGIHFEATAQPEHAVAHFEQSIAISRELADLPALGQALGYLGQTQAKLGNAQAARDALKEGEALLRAQDDPVSLAILLCTRAQAECCAGDLQACADYLAQAETLAPEASVSASSELGFALQAARRALEDARSGGGTSTITRCGSSDPASR